MRQLCAVMVVLLCAVSPAGARTIPLDGQGASIDVPDSWGENQVQGSASPSASAMILSVMNAEKNSMLQIQVIPNPHDLTASQSDLVANTKEAISNKIYSHGGQIKFTSEGATALNSVPAYSIQYTETTGTTSDSKQIQSRFYQVAANGKIYLITLRTFDASADASLQTIANSFRFDSPPVLPAPHAPEHRIRYYLMAGAGVLLVIGLGVGFYYYRQRQIYE
jgi:hypothetical protein